MRFSKAILGTFASGTKARFFSELAASTSQARLVNALPTTRPTELDLFNYVSSFLKIDTTYDSCKEVKLEEHTREIVKLIKNFDPDNQYDNSAKLAYQAYTYGLNKKQLHQDLSAGTILAIMEVMLEERITAKEADILLNRKGCLSMLKPS